MSQITKKIFYAYTETPEYEKASEQEDQSYYDTIAATLHGKELLNVEAKINARVALAEENVFVAGFEAAMKLLEVRA